MTHTESDRSPERVTQHCEANEQLLYFTSTSLTTDDRRLVFMSDRTGHPNLFDRDLATGAERQLTQNAEGHLKSYVYFNGEPYRGFGRASVSLHAPSGTVYYLQGREIRRVDADGRERVLAEYGHFTSGAPGVLVSDGYYETDGDRRVLNCGNLMGGDWISRVDADWEKGNFVWTPLCRSHSSWAGQDEHPHPIIDHGSRFVYFTSDRDGRRAVYRIPLR